MAKERAQVVSESKLSVAETRDGKRSLLRSHAGAGGRFSAGDTGIQTGIRPSTYPVAESGSRTGPTAPMSRPPFLHRRVSTAACAAAGPSISSILRLLNRMPRFHTVWIGDFRNGGGADWNRARQRTLLQFRRGQFGS